ncbi:MAG: ComEC family competence protein, partial [Sphingobacteriales bacterium]
NAILYLKKENLTRLPIYGDEIIIPNRIKLLEPPLNPETFDYARFMQFKRIYHSSYLQQVDIQFTGKNEANFFREHIYVLKKKLLANIDFYISGKDERGIAKALLLGDETDILPQITANYAGTGTLHVLSVSGLHVGLIFMVLNFLLRHIMHTKTGRFTRVVVLLFGLMFYGFLTGLSPSVLRSVTTFCFVVIGMNFRSITNIYNSIAFSALALLVYDPFLLMQLGFQLSYLAVIGIIWLHPHISKFWQPENRKLAWVRDVLAMSVAAQLATFPLGLYYFNQFPTYFLLSNLIVIPWATVVLFGGVIFLVISVLPFPEFFISFCGEVLRWLIFGLNKTVEWLSALPFAQWEGTYISIFESLLICAGMAFLIFAFIHKQKYLYHAGLVVFVLFFSFRSVKKFQTLPENRLTIHAIPKTSVISIKQKDHLYLLGDSAFINNPDQLKFHINRFAYSKFVPKPYINPVKNALGFETGNFYFDAPFGQFKDQQFLWLKSRNDLPSSSFHHKKFSFIILSKNIKMRMAELKEKLDFDKVIFTADNSFYRTASWEKECKDLGIACVNLQKDFSFAITY